MATIVTRSVKGLPLSWTEMDANFNNINTKIIQVISVKDFGAVGDGVTDDTTAIQAAITYGQSLVTSSYLSGASIFFPAGEYLISNTLNITTNNITLFGESPSSAVLYAPNANFDLIKFQNGSGFLYFVGVENLRIYTPGNATAGSHIKAVRCINSRFRNLLLIGWYDGITSDGCGKTYYNDIILSQENRTAATTLRYGLNFASTLNNNSDVHVSDFQIIYDTVTQTGSTTVLVQGADGIYFNNGHMFGAFAIAPSAVTCASIFWNNVYFDTSSVGNVIFSGTSSAYRTFTFNNCYFRNSGVYGLSLNSASGISRVLVSNCIFNYHNDWAIYSNVSSNVVQVSNCVFDDNNYGNSAAKGDIYSAGKISIMGCRFVGGGAAGTAINLTAASADCLVTGNSFTSSTAGTKITNGTPATNRIRGNNGFITKTYGQVTITNPATTSVVSHGLSVTPSIAQISLTLLDTANGVTKIFPSAVGATQFTINTNVTPTTNCSIGYMIDCEL